MTVLYPVAAATPMLLNQRFLDDMLGLLEAGETEAMVHVLTGHLNALRADPHGWQEAMAMLRSHELHRSMLADPYLARSFQRPRGYAGDAVLIDMIYDRISPSGTSVAGQRLFDVTTRSVASRAVALRRDHGRLLAETAHRARQRVCVLACGHFREGDDLVGQDVSGFTLVDQDAESIAEVARKHGPGGARLEVANVFAFLRQAGLAGVQYDLVYTLGLTDYLDDRAMTLMHRLLHRVVAPGGRAVVANFRAGLFFSGWMEAVMDWQLIYREPAEMQAFGSANGFDSRTWLDVTGSIVWAEHSKAAVS
jgi:hypothetical protein